MLGGKTAVIYLTKSMAAVFVEGKADQAYEIDWDGVKLDEAFAKIKSELKVGKVMLMLGADISYCLSLPSEENLDRESLRKQAQTHIPDDLDDHNFDWKKMGEHIQVVAVSPFILEAISHGAAQAEVKLEVILPAAVVLARLANEDKPQLLVWEGFENLGIICQNGLVHFAANMDEVSAEKVAELIDYADDKFKLKLTQVVSNVAAVKVPSKVGWDKRELEVYRYLIDNPPAKGADADVLSLTPVKSEEKQEADLPPGPSPSQIKETVDAPAKNKLQPPRPRSRLGYIIVVVLLLLLAVFAFGMYRIYSSDMSLSLGGQSTPTPTPTATPTPTPTPTPEPKLEDYPIRVLNGSGTPGEAGRVSEILEEAGFVVESVDNADSYDYDETELSSSTEVPAGVLDKLTEVLEEEFVLSEGEPLEAVEDYFILVIVGSTSADEVE